MKSDKSARLARLEQEQVESYEFIPGADYSPGIISNFSEKVDKYNQASVDALPGGFDKNGIWRNDVGPEFIEAVVDSATPFSGTFVPVKNAVKKTLHNLATDKPVGTKALAEAFEEAPMSDVNSKSYMRWIDDDDARLRTPQEIAGAEQAKYFPEDLYELNPASKEFRDASSKRLERLESERRDLETNGPIENLTEVNKKIAWLKDPQGEYDWLTETDGRNTFRLDQVLDHPKLFEADPKAGDRLVDYTLDEEGVLGNWRQHENTIGMDRSFQDRKLYRLEEEMRTLLHENQHATQDAAVWPRGGNSGMFEKKYEEATNEILAEMTVFNKGDEAALDSFNSTKEARAQLVASGKTSGKMWERIDAKYWKKLEGLEKRDAEYDVLEQKLSDLPTPFTSYQALHGEQQSRATAAQYRNGTVQLSQTKANRLRRNEIAEETSRLQKEFRALDPEVDSVKRKELMDQRDKLYAEHASLKNSSRPSTPYETLLREEGSLPEPIFSYGTGEVYGPNMVDTTKVKEFDSFAKGQLTEALTDFIDNGSTRGFAVMTPKNKQALVDKMFSSRSLEEGKWADGMTGNQSKEDVKYFGFTTKMRPDSFLSLASRREGGKHDVKKAKAYAKNVIDRVVSKDQPRIAPPFLKLKEKDGKLVVAGHEGRHRSDMVSELFVESKYNRVDIPVDITIQDMRRKDMTQEVLDMPMVSQDGVDMKGTLRDLLPDGFDTSTLN